MSDPFEALRARFVTRTRLDLQLLREGGGDPDAMAHTVHRLAGAAGVFGFQEISRAAGRVDEQMASDQIPQAEAFAALIAALEAAVGP